jgi:hypothetical protein
MLRHYNPDRRAWRAGTYTTRSGSRVALMLHTRGLWPSPYLASQAFQAKSLALCWSDASTTVTIDLSGDSGASDGRSIEWPDSKMFTSYRGVVRV